MQINLESQSKKTNVNIAFWQYLNTSYNFKERFIEGNYDKALREKLDSAFKKIPMLNVKLKQLHLNITEETLRDWKMLCVQIQIKNVFFKWSIYFLRDIK